MLVALPTARWLYLCRSRIGASRTSVSSTRTKSSSSPRSPPSSSNPYAALRAHVADGGSSAPRSSGRPPPSRNESFTRQRPSARPETRSDRESSRPSPRTAYGLASKDFPGRRTTERHAEPRRSNEQYIRNSSPYQAANVARQLPHIPPASPSPPPAPAGPPFSSLGFASPDPDRSDPDLTWTTDDVSCTLRQLRTDPNFASTAPFARVAHLSLPDQPAFRHVSKSLFSLAHTAEDSVSIASWLLRVTTPSASASPSPSEPSLGPTTPALTASDLLYHTISALLHHISLLRSRPPPTPYLDLFSTHRASISLAFNPAKHPLVLLLETYTRQYAEDKRRLDPIAAAPPPDVLAHLERLRTRHLEAVRDIHGAMREVAGNGEGVGEERVEFWSQRSARGLMEGYGHGRDFEGVKGVWDDAMREGGTGVGQQGVTVFFQQCGYCGALPISLSTWSHLHSISLRLGEDNYSAYHESLTRLGAWPQLLASLRTQHAYHLADPTSAPPLNPHLMAAAVKLADRLVKHERHRMGRKVDKRDFGKLYVGLKELSGRELWDETEGLMRSREPLRKAGKTTYGATSSQVAAVGQSASQMESSGAERVRIKSPSHSPDSKVLEGPSLDLAPAAEASARWTTAHIDSVLDHLAAYPPASGSILQALQPQLTSITHLSAPDRRAFRRTARSLFALARTGSEATELASFLLRVTGDPSHASSSASSPTSQTSDAANEIMSALLHTPSQCSPRPPFSTYLTFVASHAPQLETYRLRDLLLVHLLEIYTRLHVADERALDPDAHAPSDAALERLRGLRREFLEGVREVEGAMRTEVEEEGEGKKQRKGVLSERMMGSLMSGYGYAGSFENVQRLWEEAWEEGGSEVGQRQVAIYFDACGFSGSLTSALKAYAHLLSKGFPINENGLDAYHECLTRCGAWDELLSSYTSLWTNAQTHNERIALQSQQHSLDNNDTLLPPSEEGLEANTPATATSYPSPPPHLITPSQLTSTIKLATRLTKQPRLQTGKTKVCGPEEMTRLYAGLKGLVGEEKWREVEGVMLNDERWEKGRKSWESEGEKRGVGSRGKR